MAWNDDTEIRAADAVNASSGAIEWTADQTLNPGEQAHIQVKCVRAGTTDDLNIYVRSTLGTNDDTEWIYAITMETANDATAYLSFVLSGLYGYAIGVRSAGTTDLHTVTINQRKDGVSL